MSLCLSPLEGNMGPINPLIFPSELLGSHWRLALLLNHKQSWKGCPWGEGEMEGRWCQTHGGRRGESAVLPLHTPPSRGSEPGPTHTETALHSLELSPKPGAGLAVEHIRE